MSYFLCTNFPEFIYSPVPYTPYLNQVFRHCFSMDNLRAYVEDGSQSPSVQEQLAKRPNPSAGLSTSSSTSSASSTAPSTRAPSGPVPEVSAPTPSPSTVPRDKTVSLEDFPPPPPPSEPYELFLAHVACQMTSLPGGPPRPAAAGPAQPPKPLPTAGSRLPIPFPRFVDTSWATHPQVQVPRIRMPLPSSCYAPPPSPWTWPGRGPAVTTLQVRGPAPLTSSTGPICLPGPATLAGGPPAPGPLPPLPPTTSSSQLKNIVSTPPRFRGFFPGATPPLVPMASTTSTTVTALPTTPQADGNVSLGPTQEMVQDWKAQFFEDMRLYWQQLQGDAPPQSTVGPAVPQGNMGSDALRQLSPSGDREASRAQHKSGTKRAGSDSRHHSSSRERSSGDRARRRDRRSQTSPDSSPRRHRSPMTVAHRKVGSAPSALTDLGPLVPKVIGDVIPLLLRHLHVGTGVARLPLVGPSGPASHPSPAFAGGHRRWPLPSQYPSPWFSRTRSILSQGWCSLCGEGPETFRWPSGAASTVTLRRPYSGQYCQ